MITFNCWCCQQTLPAKSLSNEALRESQQDSKERAIIILHPRQLICQGCEDDSCLGDADPLRNGRASRKDTRIFRTKYSGVVLDAATLDWLALQ